MRSKADSDRLNPFSMTDNHPLPGKTVRELLSPEDPSLGAVIDMVENQSHCTDFDSRWLGIIALAGTAIGDAQE
jgi:hypothetical protein